MQTNYDNDVESLLEQSIDKIYPKTTLQTSKYKTNRCPFSNSPKPVLNSSGNTRKVRKVKETSKFNNLLLPEGWIRVFHESGMFFYCHISTKVVTWSMPYEMHTEPARFHRVPVRSIPCLSVLSQKLNTVEWKTLLKSKSDNAAKNNFQPSERRKEEINCEEEGLDTKKLNNKIDDTSKDVVNTSKEPEVVKEEGEIESSDENGSDEFLNAQEPILPRQYQLNHVKMKHNIRSKTLSASDLPSKRRHDEEKSVNSKRIRFISDTDIDTSNSTKEVAPDNIETMVIEEIDSDCRLLEPKELTKYCERIFTFVNEVKYLPKFTFNKKKSHVNNIQPNNIETSNQKLQKQHPQIETTVPLSCSTKLKIPNKDMYLELAGRNYSCILNMYCQHAFAVTPSFVSPANPSGISDFELACVINGTTYGVGEGQTKKNAKQKAIHKTLEILIPDFSQKISNGNQSSISGYITGTSHGSMANLDSSDDIYKLFDIMEITDPRMFNYTIKLNSISPYNLLTECMNRHCIPDNEIKCNIEKMNKHNVYKLIIGDKEVETNCENKREGRQLAAQYMLAKLHPHIQSWGGILRLYGPGSKPVKRFDMQEMQNLLLEDRGGVKNNLINLLRKKMLDLSDEYEGSSNQSKAKFKTSFQSIPIIIFHPDSQGPSNQ